MHGKSTNADTLVEWINANNLLLLNTPGTGTFYRRHIETPTVINLTLHTSSLIDKIQDWQTLPDLGSDHFAILFNIVYTSTTNASNTLFQRFNTKKADWNIFKSVLTDKIAKSPISAQIADLTFLNNTTISRDPDTQRYHQKMDSMASTLTTAIIDASNASIPCISVSTKSKPW